MSSRTAKVMIARAFGRDVEYKTSGNYGTAGVIQYTQDGVYHCYVAAVGNSARSVQQRAEKILRQKRPGTLPSDYPYLVEVVALRERTAPVLREYFGTHSVFVTAVFTPGSGWNRHPEQPLKAGRSAIRKMIRDGATAFEITRSRPLRSADFTAEELLRSMNAREKKS